LYYALLLFFVVVGTSGGRAVAYPYYMCRRRRFTLIIGPEAETGAAIIIIIIKTKIKFKYTYNIYTRDRRLPECDRDVIDACKQLEWHNITSPHTSFPITISNRIKSARARAADTDDRAAAVSTTACILLQYIYIMVQYEAGLASPRCALSL